MVSLCDREGHSRKAIQRGNNEGENYIVREEEP